MEVAMARSATVTTSEGFLATIRTSVACVDIVWVKQPKEPKVIATIWTLVLSRYSLFCVYLETCTVHCWSRVRQRQSVSHPLG